MTDFSAQLLGRTEKALNAILDRLLAGIEVTEPQWVALTLTVTAGGAPADVVTARIADALKVDAPAARRRRGKEAPARPHGGWRVAAGGGKKGAGRGG
ncbi:hypothetical protein AB0H87_41125, partial [Asanoa sp. NPDC050611]